MELGQKLRNQAGECGVDAAGGKRGGREMRERFAYLVRELQRMLSRSFLLARDVYAARVESGLAPESC